VKEILVRIDADDRRQPIDGFGVNINPVGHWRDGALLPVLDRLIDELGATIFRLDPYGFTTWIDPDGTRGPASLNPERYAAVYRGPPFQDAWGMARYLNERGAEIILNVSGVVPRWMCGPDGVTLTDFDAYTELLTSLARWARDEEGLSFQHFGPFNETDIGPPEGPFLDPRGVVEVATLLMDKLAAAGLSDLRLVVADEAHYSLNYARLLLDKPRLRQVISVVGMHCYFDIPLDGVPRLLVERGRDDWRPWLTEYGDLDQTGEIEWDVAVNSTRRLLRGLNDGFRAALVWDAYDNFHGHDDAWTLWGIMHTASRMQYTPKKRYWAARQVYRFVPPGSHRLGAEIIGEAEGFSAAAFRAGDGNITLIGLVETAGPAKVSVETGNAPAAGRMATLHVTDPRRNGEPLLRFPFGRDVTITVEGPAVFTLTTVESQMQS
jgi:O-glycosyl hydrolase